MSTPITTFAIEGDEELERALGALAAMGFRFGSAEPVTTTLLDTFDGRLYDAGLRLTARQSDRVELVLAGNDSVPAHVEVGAVPHVAGDLPPGPFRARVAEIARVRALLPRVVVTSTRTPATLDDEAGKTVATATIDRGPHIAGRGGLDGVLATIEVDEVVGYAKPARRTVAALERLGIEGRPGDALALAALATGVDLAGFDGSPSVPLDPAMPAIDGFRAVLAHLTDAIVANWQGTVDRLDPEFLHDLRIAVRRTRSVLTHGRAVLPASVRDRARERFGRLSELTGPPRDLDVYLLGWDDRTAFLDRDVAAALEPVRSLLERRREETYATLIERMRSAEAAELLAMWQAWLRDRPAEDEPLGDRAGDPLARVVGKRIRKAQEELVEQGRLIGPASPADDLHRLRKDAKKVRYLVECFGSTLESKPRKKLVKRLKALQENLGVHQDAAIHLEELRAIARELHDRGASPETMLAIGQLIGALEQVRLEARHEFAARFAAYDSPATGRALDAALRGASP